MLYLCYIQNTTYTYTKEKEMKKFRLHWLGGKKEIIEGNDIADAFHRAGIGNGSLPAVDWYEEIKNVTETTEATLLERYYDHEKNPSGDLAEYILFDVIKVILTRSGLEMDNLGDHETREDILQTSMERIRRHLSSRH